MANGAGQLSWIIVVYVYLDKQLKQNVFLIVMVIGTAQLLRIIVEIVSMGKPVNLPALKIATAIGVVLLFLIIVKSVMMILLMTVSRIAIMNGAVPQW